MDTPVRDHPILFAESLGAAVPTRVRGLLRYVAELAVVGIVYIAVARLGLTLASINPSATPVWPATGVALASVMLLGYRISPAIFVAALIVNVTNAGSVASSLGIASGNMLESLVGAYAVNRWSDGLNTFNSPSGVAKFALICLVPSTMISATLGVGSLSLAGYANWHDFRAIWTTWWMGDLAGALVIAPVIVLWGKRRQLPMERGEIIQSIMVYLAAIGVGLIAFSPLFEQSSVRTPLAFLAILPPIWAAVRCNQRDTATAAALLSCFAVWGTLENGGPFVRSSLNDAFLLLLAFMISVSVPALILSAEVAVRKRHEEHVDFVMHELSHRSKNLLSVVQSMANQIARRTDSYETFLAGFGTRLGAFAKTHDLLVQDSWRGADISDLVQVQLLPFHNPGEASIVVEGAELKLKPKAAEQIGMALHELGTNAAKYGALSTAAGSVRIEWDIESHGMYRRLRFSWKETGGPRIKETQRQGFGRLMITRLVPATLEGTASLEFEPDGIRWVLMAPSTSVLA